MKGFGLTRIGNVRLKNDDSFFVSDGTNGLYIVADGMGGYRGGEIASKIAVRTAVDTLLNVETLDQRKGEQLLLEIQANLQKEIRRNPNLKDMGTTLICCVANDRHLSFLHIGDSRAYLYQRGQLTQLTEDHTLVNILYKNGMLEHEEMAKHPQRNVLMKSITAYDSAEADYFSMDLMENEYILLCSDGLTDHLKAVDLQAFFVEQGSPEQIATALVDEALKRGGNDNIAAVVIKG